MAAQVSTLDGFFKERYGEKQDLVPEFAHVSEDIPFSRQPKLGDSYHFPVRVKRAHGVTFNSDGSAFTLNSAASGETKDANVSGSELVLLEDVSYGAASRGSGSVDAFGSVFDEVVLDMQNSAAFYREMNLLYGQSDIGIAEAIADDDTDQKTYTISKASWAPGLWAQMEGAKLDVYDSIGGSKINVTAPLVVTAVNIAERKVTATHSATDDAVLGTSTNDTLVPVGAETVWFAGIDKILTNTGSLFGISASTYGLWKANTYSAGSAALTMAKVAAAAAQAATRSGMGERVCYLSTFSWTDLNSDHAALRSFTESTKAGLDLGSQKIQYYGPTGLITLVPHPMVKAGEAFLVDLRYMKRIGSTDITFSLGVEGQQNRFFRELESKAGFQLRCYWDQALISTRPAAHTKITGIVNASLA
jgi:hypothetical protein